MVCQMSHGCFRINFAQNPKQAVLVDQRLFTGRIQPAGIALTKSVLNIVRPKKVTVGRRFEPSSDFVQLFPYNGINRIVRETHVVLFHTPARTVHAEIFGMGLKHLSGKQILQAVQFELNINPFLSAQ